MRISNAFAALVAFLATAAIALPAADASDKACTTGTAVVTAGYTINYAPATPTATIAGAGYHPEPAWESGRVVATYTYGVPTPIETGFAYAQFKCQYTCNGASPPGSSFFVKYVGGQVGSQCTCYSDLLKPEALVPYNQTVVGAWNAICKD
ncbi:hypothetical protein JX265_003270 [Neoarthrinium moseri]|uniref:Uncharacterized protein n=1 Tax=Neoarthrinium moseri TaxID=1658444 RepID=A0A9P9WTK6_9PEZI|nr:hypothetical protein JX265_003270 [Neoarthrinium moseri]